MKNYYEILGVDRNASKDTIKNAYLFKIKKYHPDIYTGDKLFAEQKTVELNHAYDTLKDENARRAYDEKLFAKEKSNKTKQSFKNFLSKIKNIFFTTKKPKQKAGKKSQNQSKKHNGQAKVVDKEQRVLNIKIILLLLLIIILILIVV